MENNEKNKTPTNPEEAKGTAAAVPKAPETKEVPKTPEMKRRLPRRRRLRGSRLKTKRWISPNPPQKKPWLLLPKKALL